MLLDWYEKGSPEEVRARVARETAQSIEFSWSGIHARAVREITRNLMNIPEWKERLVAASNLPAHEKQVGYRQVFVEAVMSMTVADLARLVLDIVRK